MDYYTPLDQRKMSFKEFMLEWVVNHHERMLEDYGLKKPWYWDTFMARSENGHHAMHLGTWFWRPTLFWKPNAGVSKAEREWLNEKYPTWEDNWGVLWDEIIAQRQRRPDREDPSRDAAGAVQPHPAAARFGLATDTTCVDDHVYNGRIYQFDSRDLEVVLRRRIPSATPGT